MGDSLADELDIDDLLDGDDDEEEDRAPISLKV